MKFTTSVILMLFSGSVYAVTCSNYEPPNNEKIVLEVDDGATYFSAPDVLEGRPLESITLWAYPKDKSSQGELVAPLAFKVSKGIAKGQFAITSPFVEAELTAIYSTVICGPRLEASVSI